MKRHALLLALAACTSPRYRYAETPAWVEDTTSYGRPVALGTPAPATPYLDVASTIIKHARLDRGAYARLAELTDTVGARLSGSPALDKAIAWAADRMKRDGLDVRTEKVMVPHWQRGTIAASITAPITRPLNALALGGSVATPRAGITARVVVVTSWEDMEAKKDQLAGAIVLFDVPFPVTEEDTFSGYGAVTGYRSTGAARASAHGAVAVLVRSITPHSLDTVHTGAMRYLPETKKKIPGAAITVEDATQIARLAAAGPVTVTLRMDPRELPDAPSANVIGELRGREKPDEIIVLAAHLDSWDVGQGAHDDGAGCVMMMHALATLKKLGLVPRRTIRVVLYTNEENGLRGAAAYAEQHAAELPNHVFAIEADAGGFSPRGLSVRTTKESEARVLAQLGGYMRLVAPLGMRELSAGGAGADIGAIVAKGVIGAGYLTDGRTYFDIHHTHADTLDKVDPQHLADGVATLATLAYVIAEAPTRLGQ